ncbi:peptidylprolyl isomerase [Dokdonella soli]|uniref:Peptidyl-prolyl cis-trans isomerase n=1 Tax=Dokdonella soli TaxID=529810 RepID=A0ABN1ID53_9GAMM
MNVEANKVVSFHYSVSDGGDVPVDSSRERGEPLTVLIGHGNIIPGLEKALHGHAVGDRFAVSVAPGEAYGERRADFFQRVPKKYFEDAEHLQPGMSTVLQTKEGGPRMVVVQKVGSSVIDVDLNHPLAGKTLAFDIEITDIRDATAEEISHRHAHGAGGHEHH